VKEETLIEKGYGADRSMVCPMCDELTLWYDKKWKAKNIGYANYYCENCQRSMFR